MTASPPLVAEPLTPEQAAIAAYLGDVGATRCRHCGAPRHDFVPKATYQRWKDTGRLVSGIGGTAAMMDPELFLWSPCSDASQYVLLLTVRVADFPGLRAEIGQHCERCDFPGNGRDPQPSGS